MPVVDHLARPLLASVFISGGTDALLKPAKRAEQARPVVERLHGLVPALPEDPETAVRVNGAIHVAVGLALATGRLPRLSALVLAATLVPTTLGGHRFWEQKDRDTRHQQRVHFTKNVAILGGLLLAATDRGGAPSLAWRARHAARKVPKP